MRSGVLKKKNLRTKTLIKNRGGGKDSKPISFMNTDTKILLKNFSKTNPKIYRKK